MWLIATLPGNTVRVLHCPRFLLACSSRTVCFSHSLLQTCRRFCWLLGHRTGNQFHERAGPNRVMIFGSLRWRTGEGESLKWLGSHSRMNEVNSHPTRKYRDGAGPPAVPSRLFVESNHFSQTLLYEQANFLMVGAQPISLNELIPFTSRQYLRIRAPAHGGDRVAAAVGTQF
jgi:hypothetical protein